MDRVPYTHPLTAKSTKQIAGLMFHPGDTRLIPRSLHPDPAISGAKRAPAAQPVVDDSDPATLLADSVKDITAKLPAIDDDRLAAMLDLEQQADKPRKGVVTGIEEEQLRRRVDSLGELLKGDDMDAIAAKLPDLSDDDLVRLVEIEKQAAAPRDVLLSAAEAEQKARAEAKTEGQGTE